MESIKELRTICYKSQQAKPNMALWHDRIDAASYRAVAIYITKLFLKIGISANQATIIGLLMGIVGGAFLIFKDPGVWLVGAVILYISHVFDFVDGQIARYHGATSQFGAYLDRLVGGFLFIYIFICMALGIYAAVHSISVFVLAFLGMAGVFMQRHSLLVASLGTGSSNENFYKKSLTGDPIVSEGIFSQITRHGSSVLTCIRYEGVILAVSLMDYFISPMVLNLPVIASFDINVRYLYFALNALAMFVGAILIISHNLRGGANQHYGK